MLTKSAKAKARRLQNSVSEDLNRELGWNTRPAIMGEKGSDIKGKDSFDIECKNDENVSIWRGWRQGAERKTETQIQLLIMQKNHSPRLAIVEWDFMLKVLKAWENQ